MKFKRTNGYTTNPKQASSWEELQQLTPEVKGSQSKKKEVAENAAPVNQNEEQPKKEGQAAKKAPGKK